MKVRKNTSDLISMGKDQAEQHPESPTLSGACVGTRINRKKFGQRNFEADGERGVDREVCERERERASDVFPQFSLLSVS